MRKVRLIIGAIILVLGGFVMGAALTFMYPEFVDSRHHNPTHDWISFAEGALACLVGAIIASNTPLVKNTEP